MIMLTCVLNAHTNLRMYNSVDSYQTSYLKELRFELSW